MPATNLDAINLPLFVPADRPDRYKKAAASGADAIIIDLEDAVLPDAKDMARASLAAALTNEQLALPILVRVNAAGTEWHVADLEICAGLPLAGIVLPKAEAAEDVLRASEASTHPVIALIESARGVTAAQSIAAAAARLAFGSIDYAADISAEHTRESLLYARSALVVASRAAERAPPLDGVTVAVQDGDAIAADCRHALSLGMGGKLLIHPAQIAPARQAFEPSEQALAWAQGVRAAAAASTGGAIRFEGAMVDAPVIKRAEQILRRAAGQKP